MQYDGTLQMFIEQPHEPDRNQLAFLRWLMENNRLEHEVAGPPSGELLVMLRETVTVGGD